MLYDRIRNIRSDHIWKQVWRDYSAKFPNSLATETQEDFALTLLAFLVHFYDDAQVIIDEKRTQESFITRGMNWVQSYFQNSLTKDVLQRAKTETAGFFGGIIALYTFFSNKSLLSTESKDECLEKAQRFCNYFRDDNDFLEQAIQLSIYLSFRFGAIIKLLHRGKEGQDKLAEFFSCAVIAELLNSRSERATTLLSLEKLLFNSIPDEKTPLYTHERFLTVITDQHKTIPLIDLVLSTPIEIVGLSQTYEPIREASVRQVETQYLLETEENIASQYHRLRSSFPVLEALIKGIEADFNQYNQARNKHDLLLKMMVNFNSSCEFFKAIPSEKNMTSLIEGYDHQLSKQAVALYGLIKEYAITDQTVLANESYRSCQSYFNWFEQKKNASRSSSHSSGLVQPNRPISTTVEEKIYVGVGALAGGVKWRRYRSVCSYVCRESCIK